MKVSCHQKRLRGVAKRNGRPRAQVSRRASALLIVLILLSIMAVLVASNSARLTVLKRELQLIEKSQTQKFEEPIGRANVSPHPPASRVQRSRD